MEEQRGREEGGVVTQTLITLTLGQGIVLPVARRNMPMYLVGK